MARTRVLAAHPCGHPVRVEWGGQLFIDTRIWGNPSFAGVDRTAQLAFFAGLSVIGEHGGGDLICSQARWFDPLREGWENTVRAGFFAAEPGGLRVLQWFGCRVVPGRLASDRAWISPGLRQAVFARDGWRCLHCGTDQNLTLDHIHPWSLGGPDTLANLQTLCRSCNSTKGARV